VSRFILVGLAAQIAERAWLEASNFDCCGLSIKFRSLLAFQTSTSRHPLSWYAIYIDVDADDSKVCIAFCFSGPVELVLLFPFFLSEQMMKTFFTFTSTQVWFHFSAHYPQSEFRGLFLVWSHSPDSADMG
jgi:hypothetical protein